MKKGNSSSDNSIGKVFLIVLVIFLSLAIILESIFNGVLDKVLKFIDTITKPFKMATGIIQDIKILGWRQTWRKWRGKVYKTPGVMDTIILENEDITDLVNTLENEAGLNTKVSGLSPIILRKIILAEVVSTSLADTLCAVPVTEEDIVEYINEKTEKKCNDLKQAQEEFLFKEEGNAQKSLGWPKSAPNYEIWRVYNSENEKVSNVFFYFKDEDVKFGDSDSWYLAAMGKTKLTAADEEENSLKNVGSGEAFKKIKEQNFDNSSIGEKFDKENEFNFDNDYVKDCVNSYYKKDSETIVVYNVKTVTKDYEYSFNSAKTTPSETVKGEEPFVKTAELEETEIKISDKIDTSSYALPMELLIDMLNISSSADFVEKFIDVALEEIEVTVKAYPIKKVEESYEITEYNINNDFVFEAYDMVNGTDHENDNFAGYSPIIYNRCYNSKDFKTVMQLRQG